MLDRPDVPNRKVVLGIPGRGSVYNGSGMLISTEDIIKQWKEHFILKNNVKMIWSHLRKYFI